MKAIVYQQFGTTEVLQIIEEPRPSIKSDQVLIKVKAFSINPMDWKIRNGEMKLMSGSRFPKHTGTDFSGIVEAIGTSVSSFEIGDEVFGVVGNMMKDGASAEYVAISSSHIWRKPPNITFAQAASITVVGTAAVTALKKMDHIDAQTHILVNGATGGFGMFLLQLLKKTGSNVTAVASSKGTAYAKKWGATSVIDYAQQDVLSGKAVYDIVIDLSGKMGYENAKQIMKPKALFLNPTPRPIDIPTSLIKNPFKGKKHITIISSPSAKYTYTLLDAIDNGLDIEVNKIFPFIKFREAYQYAENGGYVGKVVVEIN